MEVIDNKEIEIGKFVKAESEKELVVIHDEERVKWNPDAMIKTESGKAWFYQTLEDIKLIGQIKLEMLLTEMANMKYKTDEDTKCWIIV